MWTMYVDSYIWRDIRSNDPGMGFRFAGGMDASWQDAPDRPASGFGVRV